MLLLNVLISLSHIACFLQKEKRSYVRNFEGRLKIDDKVLLSVMGSQSAWEGQAAAILFHRPAEILAVSWMSTEL